MADLLQRFKRKSRKSSSTSSEEDNRSPRAKKSKFDPPDENSDHDKAHSSEVRDCGKLIQSLKERGIQQMCCFVILLLFNEMQMSVRRFSAIPHLRGTFGVGNDRRSVA